MNTIASLIAKLGLDKSEFGANLKESVEESKGFEKAWKDIGKLFAAGGMTQAVLGFFKSTIEHARASKGEFDENTEAVKRFGDAWDSTVSGAKDFGVQVLGVLNQVGEYVGLTLKGWARGFGGFWESIKKLDFKEAFASFSKGLDEVVQEHVALKESEKALFETQRQIEESGERRAKLAKNRRAEEEKSIKAIEKAEKEAAEAREKAADEHIKLMDRKNELEFDALAIEDQVKRLVAERLEITLSIERMKREGLDATSAEVALLETQAKIKKAQAEITEKEQRATKELLKSEEEIAALSRSELLTQMNLVEARTSKLNAEGRVTSELERQLDLLRRQLDARREILNVDNRYGREDKDLSDRELAEKARNLREGMQSAQQNRNSGMAFFFQQKIEEVEFELGRRRGFRRAFGREGEEAFNRYSAFDEQTLRNYIRPEDEKRAQQTLEALQDIQQRLSGSKPIFGQKPSG